MICGSKKSLGGLTLKQKLYLRKYIIEHRVGDNIKSKRSRVAILLSLYIVYVAATFFHTKNHSNHTLKS